MATATLWQHTPSGDTTLVGADLEHLHGDCGDDCTRIEVTTDDPRWVEAVQRENERLDERGPCESGTIFVATSYQHAADLEYDDWVERWVSLRPLGWAGQADPDNRIWRETTRRVICDSREWSNAVKRELYDLRNDGLVAA